MIASGITRVEVIRRARARLRNEVRQARQISHANVCRVYDIGEANRELYLSMEYVDGEDLAALLKRIGRLSIDKGIEIARKLCAGLAAAHAKGVLHRDFKPANIMIDGQGEVRIMDFGLAAVAENIDPADVRSGTPAYMSPEQLAGREATRQSDIYALGLVLYELFTGKPPFATHDLQELLRMREGTPATTPSTLIPEITPRLERAVLSCLEPDAKLRPSSALEVSASLPGGDPLAEALAAGETPSPDLVAAAGPTEGLAPRRALLLTMTIVALATAIVFVTPRVHMLLMVPLANSPETLTVRARDAVRALGYDAQPTHTATGFETDFGYYAADHAHELRAVPGGSRYEAWRSILGKVPSPLTFWYRQSPDLLIPRQSAGPVRRVTLQDPPIVDAGMIVAVVDLEGHLQKFTAVPADGTVDSASGPDWTVPFRLAGLDLQRFTSSGSTAAGDGTRVSWTGSRPDRPDLPIRVDAMAHGGRIAAFDVRYPWTSATVSTTASPSPPMLATVLGLLLIAATALSARYNVQRGRSDVRGAYRLAIGFGAIVLAIWALTTDTDAAASFADLQSRALPYAAFAGLMSGLVYLGIEPWIRRYWPETMITWSRVLSGRWADPVVGRDVLVAIAWGLGCTLTMRLIGVLIMRLGDPPEPPTMIYSPMGLGVAKLLSVPVLVADLLAHVAQGYASATAYFLGLFLFRAVLHRGWLAAMACFGFSTTMTAAYLMSPASGYAFGSMNPVVLLALLTIAGVISLIVSLRHGIFAAVMFTIVAMLTDGFLLTPHFGAWYGRSTLVGLVIVGALTVWALRTSLAGRPLLNVDLGRSQR